MDEEFVDMKNKQWKTDEEILKKSLKKFVATAKRMEDKSFLECSFEDVFDFIKEKGLAKEFSEWIVKRR